MSMIVIILLVILGIVVASAISVNYNDWKYYSKMYPLLVTGKWYTSGSSYNQHYNDSLPDMVYFGNEKDIKLNTSAYLFANHISNFDPYHLYWQLKYNHWFKKNVL